MDPGATGGLGAALGAPGADLAGGVADAPGAPSASGVPAAATVWERAVPHCVHLRAPSIASAPHCGHRFFVISTVGGLKHIFIPFLLRAGSAKNLLARFFDLLAMEF